MRIAIALVALLFVSSGVADELTPDLRHSGFTELHAAAWNGDVAKIRALVKGGMDVNVASKFGTRPLHSAVIALKPESIRVLLELGADIEARDNIGRTPLFMSADVNNEPRKVMEVLLAAGASPVAKDKYGKTPLQAAFTDEGREVLSAHLDKLKKEKK